MQVKGVRVAGCRNATLLQSDIPSHANRVVSRTPIIRLVKLHDEIAIADIVFCRVPYDDRLQWKIEAALLLYINHVIF